MKGGQLTLSGGISCTPGAEDRCFNAKSLSCTCACHGANHGRTRARKQDEVPSAPSGFVGEVFTYQGYGVFPSKCGLRIIRKGEKAVVILTELASNPGTSITNMYERIATQIYRERLAPLPVENITWVEHYPVRERIPESFDKVEMPFVGSFFSTPKWQRVKGDELQKLLKEDTAKCG